MMLLRISYAFARQLKKPKVVPPQPVEEVVIKEQFKKNFTKSPEFMMASNHFAAMQVPANIIKKARKVFNKYPADDLREASYKYMRMYQLLHALEKPKAITIQGNTLFENVQNLQSMTDKKIIHLRKPGTSEEELWLNAQTRKANKDKAVDRIHKADQDAEHFQYSKPLIEYDKSLVVSYLLRKMPGSYAVANKVLSEIRKRNLNFSPKSYLDYGSGVGTWAWAVSQVFPDCETMACVEPNVFMTKLGKYMSEDYKKIQFFESLSHTLELNCDQFDLITMAYVLEEMSRPESRLLVLQSLWSKLSDDGIMILTCPGSPTGFRFINDFREWVLSQQGFIVAPCQHQKSCPLAKEGFQWCHFDQQVQQWPKDVFPKHLHENPTVSEKYSYLAVSKHPIKQKAEDWPRLLFPVLKKGQHLIMDLCTPEGTAERRIIGKSHGIEGGYYECKHLRRGDLWRFPKRVPSKVTKRRRKQAIKVI